MADQAPSAWSEDRVSAWLTASGYGDLAPVFRENDINGELLVQLDHELLKELGLPSVGRRMKLLKDIQVLIGGTSTSSTSTTSTSTAAAAAAAAVEPPVTTKQRLSADLTKVMADLDSEINVLNARTASPVMQAVQPADPPPPPMEPMSPTAMEAQTEELLPPPVVPFAASSLPLAMAINTSQLPPPPQQPTPQSDAPPPPLSPLSDGFPTSLVTEGGPQRPPRPSRSLFVAKASIGLDDANKSMTMPFKHAPSASVSDVSSSDNDSSTASPLPKVVRLGGKVLPPPPSAPKTASPASTPANLSSPATPANNSPITSPPLSPAPARPMEQHREPFPASLSSMSLVDNDDDEDSDDDEIPPPKPERSQSFKSTASSSSTSTTASAGSATTPAAPAPAAPAPAAAPSATPSTGVVVSDDNRPVIATALRDVRPTPERPDLDFRKGDLFVVLDMKDVKEWRVKPFGKRGNVVSIPRDLLQIDSSVFTRIQQQYGQKVFTDEPAAGSKQAKKATKSVIAVPAKALQSPMMQGYLYKIGATVLSKAVWRRRWCVLKDYVIYYYRSPDDAVALGKVPLPGYVVSPAPDDVPLAPRKFMFKVTHPNSRTYVFAAETKEDMDRWMYTINLATVLEDLPE